VTATLEEAYLSILAYRDFWRDEGGEQAGEAADEWQKTAFSVEQALSLIAQLGHYEPVYVAWLGRRGEQAEGDEVPSAEILEVLNSKVRHWGQGVEEWSRAPVEEHKVEQAKQIRRLWTSAAVNAAQAWRASHEAMGLPAPEITLDMSWAVKDTVEAVRRAQEEERVDEDHHFIIVAMALTEPRDLIFQDGTKKVNVSVDLISLSTQQTTSVKVSFEEAEARGWTIGMKLTLNGDSQ
jgi:hypothetical protein